MHSLILAQAEPPAGGAAIGQVVLATGLVTAILGALALLVWRHRAGRQTALGRAATLAERASGLPAWAALPSRGERPGPAPIRLGPDWYAPVGGVLIAVCGAFALGGFPLDDLWHRLFGQDVTLWGPTHLMMLGGAAMTLIGQAVLLREGMWERRQPRGERSTPQLVTLARRVALMAGLLLGLSIFPAA